MKYDTDWENLDWDTNKIIEEVGKLINSLGGDEWIVLPALRKLLEKKFNCKETGEQCTFFGNNESVCFDFFGISKDAYYFVEIYNNFTEESFQKLIKLITKFKLNIKPSRNLKIYLVVAATSYEKVILDDLYSNGIYFISLANDLVELKVPENFEPKEW